MERDQNMHMSFENYCHFIETLQTCMDDYPYVYDLKQDRCFISEKAVERFRIEENLFADVMETFRQFVYPADYNMLIDDLNLLTAGQKSEHDVQYRWVGKDNHYIWVHAKGQIVGDEDGGGRFLVGCINEIGERPAADNISGLRQTNSIKKFLDEYEGTYPKGFFLRLGLDGFKNIIETFGMDYGDQVIYSAAECIRKCLLPGQNVYRAISDEFIVTDFAGGTVEDADLLYRRIRMEIDKYIESKHYECVYTISGGVISTSDLETGSYAEVMRLSRFNLSMAKQQGRNLLYTYCQEDYDKFLRRRRLLRALRRSVENHCEGFVLYFQPITNAETGEIYAAESLSRFFLDGEMISPAEFIPILEESGLIIPVGKWIIRTAVAMCKECQKSVPHFKISVNLSYVQIKKSAVTDEIMSVLKEFDLSPDSLIAELTESGEIEHTSAIRKVWDHLKENGVRIAIDDFGTGYSNLQYINDMVPHVVKIDRSFTMQALSQKYMNRLLANIIRMAHNMNLNVCIEGIETREELEKILELHPDYIQGFYYGMPCDRDTFLADHIYRKAV